MAGMIWGWNEDEISDLYSILLFSQFRYKKRTGFRVGRKGINKIIVLKFKLSPNQDQFSEILPFRRECKLILVCLSSGIKYNF